MGLPVVIRCTAGNLQGGWTNVRITVAMAQCTPLCVLYHCFYTLMVRMREKGGERKEGEGEGVLLLVLLRCHHCCVIGTKEGERGAHCHKVGERGRGTCHRVVVIGRRKGA